MTCTIGGLTDEVAYTITVTAHNRSGDGDVSLPSEPVVPGGSRFHALVPARVLDSRAGPTNIGRAFHTAWDPGVPGAADVAIGGHGGVPIDADTVVLNVTVVGPTAGSYLQMWPTGAPQPQYGSSLDFRAGQIVPNQVTVKLGTGGIVRVLNAVGHVDVVIDVMGYYGGGSDGDGDGFVPMVPRRLVDTPARSDARREHHSYHRPGVGGHPIDRGRDAHGPTRRHRRRDERHRHQRNGPVVPAALAVLFARPEFGSNLNFQAGQIVPNTVTVKVGSGSMVDLFNAVGHVDVVIDVVGYYVPDRGSAFRPVVPARVLDSRAGSTNISRRSARRGTQVRLARGTCRWQDKEAFHSEPPPS